MRIDGRIEGLLYASHRSRRLFTDHDEALLLRLADQVAVAINNRRLLAAEQAARATAEAAERRATVLAEASQLLAGSLDDQATLASLARLAVPEICDLCVIDVRDDDGTIGRAAAAFVDPEKDSLLQELQRSFPIDPAGPHPVARVLRTGQPEVVAEISDAIMETIAPEPEHRRIGEMLGYRSYIVVPLVARGQILGALSLVSGSSGRRHDRADLALAEELARRAAMAVDNARLYAKEQAARGEAETAAQRLRLALFAGGLGTWEWMVGTGKLSWSASLEAIHGLAPGIFPGTFDAFLDEIHPEDRDRVLGAVQEAVEQGREHHVEYRIVRQDGAIRWVEGRGHLFRDSEGRPERMVGVCSDITERKLAENRFRLAVEAAPTAMILVDREGTIRLVNALGEQLFGYTREELIGQPVEQLVPLRFRPAHPEHRTEFSAAPRRRPMGAGRDLHARRKDGSEVPVEIGLSPFETSDNAYVLAAVTDISSRKHAEQERASLLAREQAAREQAEVANRTKDQFLAMLSHELRQPLNTMLGWVRILRTGQASAPQRDRALEAIERSTRAQARMIDDLLDIARIEAGKLTLDRRPVTVGSLVAETVDSLQHEARAKGLTIEAHLDPGAAIVSADADRLRQVLVNLIGNAIKYTPSGGHVRVDLAPGDGVVQVVVRDTGVGIERDFLPRVFERFRQADWRQAGTQGGLGLGLAIVREIVEMHGGAVEAQSEGPGRGATFTVTLPRSGEA
jgi:PAS domain S-box-containing protein